KYIAAQTPLYRQHRVEVLQRQGSSWRLQAVTPEGPCSVTAQGIVLAIPAPQVLPLLPPLPEADEMAAAIARVTFEPCFSAMVGYGGPVDDISSLGLQSPTPVLRWVGFEAAKRPMERVILTLQSSMTFAQQALDWPLAEVAACLVKSAETLSQVAALGAPQWQQGHRWRYAFCQQPCPQSCLARPDLALACCGDWCRPHQNVGAVETALRSGEAAATAIAAALSDSRG
ncbi:MAG: FAD-dependent oxidoreductase, partial [Cyanobacteria bacterium P01_A01_bin.135]